MAITRFKRKKLKKKIRAQEGKTKLKHLTFKPVVHKAVVPLIKA